MFDDLEKSFFSVFSVKLLVQVVIFLIGLSISGFGLFQLFNSTALASSKTVDEVAREVDNKEFAKITVDIGGAVNKPGVYEFSVGTRVNDLIDAAGGFSDSVDKYYINKVLNLSERLDDGKKVYVPTLEESLEAQRLLATDSNDTGGSTSASGSTGVNGLISINSASKSELMGLDGIGEKRSEDIINGRPYNSISQLVEKQIITESIFEDIKNDVSY